MKKFIFSILLFSIFSLTIKAQTIKVVDKSDLQPIENVAVTSNNLKTITNKKGEVDISVVGDNDIITFSHLSYQTVSLTKRSIIDAKYTVLLTDNVIKLNEVVLTANRFSEDKAGLPQKIEVITDKQISFINPQTSGDLLAQTGKVFVQQSQLGGSSPVIRGFEASKVLLVVDGVRMNNAIYRSGHLQNVITIDPNMLNTTEILYGPGSVVYGSDAIGGVMAFYSKNPELSSNENTLIKGGAFTRYSSANNEIAGNVNINFGFKKWGFLTSFSYKNLDDLRAGNERDSKYGDWGKCLYYAERINGKDSMMVNNDPNIQKRSGYSQYDILQKVLFQPNMNSRYIFNFQFSNSSNVPRYDRLAEMDGSKLKYADWYYGPQRRLLSSLRAEYNNNSALYDKAYLTAAYQNISEIRVNRKFNNANESHQEETVDVLSFNADLMKSLTQKNELRYGIEVCYNNVGSEAYAINVNTNVKSYNIASRYPDNGSKYITLAAFATHNWKLSEKLIFSQGLRLSSIHLKSEYSDTMMKITKFPFDKTIEQNNTALNGNIGFVYMPGYDWRFAVSGSSGFRAPNVDDVGKVNDSKPGNAIVIPNPDLKPEYAYNAEVTIGKVFFKKLQFEVTGFYTLLKDAIVVKASTLNGMDSIIYGGKKTAVQSAKNEGEAYVYGIQGGLVWQLTEFLSVSSNLTYTYGRVKDTDTPLDHIPPIYGFTGIKLETKKIKAEVYSRYNGWKHLSDYSTSGEDNLQQATADGTPSWYTLNFRTAYQLHKFLNVQVGLENILDKHYRYFASGISAPGRNLFITLRSNF
jgi:hemoglobin/transferrin/lactoferrin receptor protein